MRKVDDCEVEICNGTVGAIHELQVSVDLMRKQFDVFRALSPATPVDLVAIKNGECKRVQVTKGQKWKDGHIAYSPHNPKTYDILAVSFVDGEIMYFPPL